MDEDAFIASLEEQGIPFIRVKKEIDRKAIREQCRTVVISREDGTVLNTVCNKDGVMLEGMTVEATPETLVCRFSKGDKKS